VLRHRGTSQDLASSRGSLNTRAALRRRRQALADTEALARFLLRAEAVASSRIEGLEVNARRLLHAEAAQVLGDEVKDVTAVEVLGNIQAISWVLQPVSGTAPDQTLSQIGSWDRKPVPVVPSRRCAPEDAGAHPGAPALKDVRG